MARSVSAQYDGLIINEYMARPNLGSGGPHFDSNNDGVNNNFDDEFVEILNMSTAAVDMAGCQIFDAIRVRHVFSSRVIPAGGSIVVFGGGGLLNFTNPPGQVASTGTLSLNDTGPESIILYDPQTQQIDRVDYTASQPAAVSMTRYPDAVGGFTNHYLATTNTARASPGRAVHGAAFLTNHPPIIVQMGNKTAFVGLLLEFPVHAYDPADQDSITLSATGQPTNATFSATGGVGLFSFTPSAGQAGQAFNVAFIASDADGAETNTITVSVVNPVTEEKVWINELHYDNTGTDADEGVEIAGTAGTVLTNYTLILYSGGNGQSYNTRILNGTIDDEQCGFGAVWFGYPVNGLQNEVEGVALVKGSNEVIQFLSYEGSFVAANGPAAGMTSVNIGVQESGTTPVGYSLQLVGTGNQYSAFTWVSPRPHSRGLLNTGQIITCVSPAEITLNKTVYVGHNGGASGPGVETVQGTNGALVTYFMIVQNTGGSLLTNVVVTDDTLGITPIPAGTLQPGAAFTTHVESVIAGDLRNTASATGYDPQGQPVSDSDTAEVIQIIPAVSIQKTVYAGHNGGASCPGAKLLYGAPGAPITYCFQVSNNGNTNLTNVAITDASLGLTPIHIGTLLAGQQVFASVTSSISGSLTNVATVSGLDPLSNVISDVDSAVVIAINPAIEIQKTVYLGHDGGAACPGGEFVQGTNGTRVTYCFRITNTGDATLTNVVVSDAALGITPFVIGTMTNGQVEHRYAESTITATRTNSAAATGYAPNGDLVMHTDTAEVELLPPPPSSECPFDVTDLGTLGGNMSKAYGINDQGHVVGESTLSNGETRAFIWKNGVMSNVFERAGLTNSVANDINNLGQIAGRANDETGAMRGFVFFPSGAISNIGVFPGGNFSDAASINDHGQVAGYAHVTNALPPGRHPHPLIWTNGAPQDLGTFNGYSNFGYSGQAFCINNSTQVVGYAHRYNPGDTWPAFLWYDMNGNGIRGDTDGAEMIYLGAMGGYAGTAYGINDLGQIVGGGPLPGFWNPYRAYIINPDNGVWYRDTNGDGVNDLLISLGLMGGTWSEARAINDSGLTVGFFISNGVKRAFIYDGLQVKDLNGLLCTNSGWILHEALAVNNSGQIAGYGTHNGQTRAFLLTAGAAIGAGQVEITRVIPGGGNPADHTIVWRGFGASLKYTVEAASAVTSTIWQSVAPTGQWPITATYWRNNLETNPPTRIYRVRSQATP